MKQNRTEPLSIPMTRSSGTAPVDPHAKDPTDGPALGLERWLARRIAGIVDNLPVRLVLWDGEEFGCHDITPAIRVVIRSRGTLYRLFVNPDLYFGDDYSAGRIEVEGNLVHLLEFVYRKTRGTHRIHFLQQLLRRHLNQPHLNTLSHSRDNIYHHYDIGNAFYKLWLDEQMVYTCAYFPTPTATLETAQHAKMDHICRKLQLSRDETVIEAGCGWGALSLHMVRHYGVKVKAFNISHEQVSYARERAAAEGLADRVEYIEDDYRNITRHFRNHCDAFVSVGMLEHVGVDHYRELGAVIDHCLAEHGRGLIHSIGRNKPFLMSGWVERRIFPGAYPPALREMMAIFEPYEFSVLDVENIRLHYAKTLEHWLERFEQHEEKVREMFDETFVRAWRLYLSGSIASFQSGLLQLFQIVFIRGSNNEVPWTRDYMYTD